MFVVVGSIKGSPGATSMALGMASHWPQGRPVLIEADSDGGDLATRFDLSLAPDLTNVVVRARAAGPDAVNLDEFTRRLPVGADVVVGPLNDAASATVEQLAGTVRLLRRTAEVRPVIVDAGRLSRHPSVQALLSAADHLVVVTAPQMDALAHLAVRVEHLRAATRGQLWVLLCGAGPVDADEAQLSLQVPVLACTAHDKFSAGMLSGLYPLAPGWRRRPMVRAAHRAAQYLHAAGPAVPAGENTEVPAP